MALNTFKRNYISDTIDSSHPGHVPGMAKGRSDCDALYWKDGNWKKIVAKFFIPRVYLEFLSRQKMVAMSGGSRPNQFCKCAIVSLRTYYILYIIVMCDINMTTFDKGG